MEEKKRGSFEQRKGAKGERILELDFSILKSKRGDDGNKIYVFPNVQQSGGVSDCQTGTDVWERVEAHMNPDGVWVHFRAVRGARVLVPATAPGREKVKASRNPSNSSLPMKDGKTGNQNKHEDG